MTAFRSLPMALAVAVALLSCTFAAGAGEVYKWKDARGVTHYGDRPPASATVTRPAVRKGPTTAASTVVPTEDPQCVTARSNLALLKGTAPVGMDNDKDGKPDSTMDAAERARQANLAQAGVAAYCKPATTATASTPSA